MKVIFGLINDIRATLKNTPILVLIIISGISSAVMSHLISVCVIENETAKKSQYAVYNTFSVLELGKNNNIDIDEIVNNESIVNAFLFFISPDNDCIIIGWYGNQPNNWFPLGEGRFFGDDTIQNPAYVSDSIAAYRSGEKNKIQLINNEYQIVGSTRLSILNLLNGLDDQRLSHFYGYDKFVFIPISQINSMEYSNACLRVQIEHERENAHIQMEQMAYNILDGDIKNGIIWPKDPWDELWLNNLISFVAIGFLCLLSFANIIALYWNLLSRHKYKYAVYSLIGAEIKKLWFQVLILFLCLFMCSVAIACLSALLIRPILSLLDINYKLSLQHIVAVSCFELAAVLIVSLPKMKNTIHQSCYDKLRKGIK